MSGAELLLVRKPTFELSFHDYLAEYIKADTDFMDGIRRGVADCKEGRVTPWVEVKKELGIG